MNRLYYWCSFLCIVIFYSHEAFELFHVRRKKCLVLVNLLLYFHVVFKTVIVKYIKMVYISSEDWIRPLVIKVLQRKFLNRLYYWRTFLYSIIFYNLLVFRDIFLLKNAKLFFFCFYNFWMFTKETIQLISDWRKFQNNLIEKNSKIGNTE